MRYLNGWHPFESIRFDLVKITIWRCLILQIWEQQKQLLRNQRVIQECVIFPEDFEPSPAELIMRTQVLRELEHFIRETFHGKLCLKFYSLIL